MVVGASCGSGSQRHPHALLQSTPLLAKRLYDGAILTKAQLRSVLFTFLAVILIPAGFVRRWLLAICNSQYMGI